MAVEGYFLNLSPLFVRCVGVFIVFGVFASDLFVVTVFSTPCNAAATDVMCNVSFFKLGGG